jgi:phosphoglycerate dehydrogenase-like enzyme
MQFFLSNPVLEMARERIVGAVPQATFTTVDESGLLTGAEVRGVDIVFLSSDLIEWTRTSDGARGALLTALSAPSLAWVQTASAGVEHPIFHALLERGVRVTNAPGLHAPPIAEYVFAQLLSLTKRVREHAALQARRHYTPLDADELRNKTLGSLGYGGIGRATARVARAFGMRVIATRRTPGPDPDVDKMLPPERLDEMLASSDVLLVAAPLTAETRRLLDADRLSRMRPDAILINVARGAIVDETALAEALRGGRLRAAVLDVHEQEPLPPGSPLWALERCIITAHDSSRSPRTLDRALDLFVGNLNRFVAKMPLEGDIIASVRT